MSYYEMYALGGAYLKAKKAGFSFCKAESRFVKCSKWIEDTIAKMKEEPTVYMGVIALLAILAAIVLGYIEAINCSQSLVGLGFSETSSIIIGWGFCCIGLIAGEEIAAGLQKKDEFTGKRIITPRAICGFVLTAVYLCGQYYLASQASAGSDGLGFMAIYVLLISVLEVLIGAIYLKSSITTISVLVAKLRMRFIQGRMGNASKRTEKYWQRYLFDLNKASIPITQADETPQVKRARDYYNNGGIYPDDTASSTSNPDEQ